MNLRPIIQQTVAIADDVVGHTADGGLQADVFVSEFLYETSDGTRMYDVEVRRSALVEMRTQAIRDPAGSVVQSSATLTFLTPAPVHLHARVRYPPSPGKLVTGTVVNIGGLVDPVRNEPFFTTVYMGL